MSTMMIVALIFMIARLSLRIGLVLVLIWGVIRLIDRWRLPTAAPVAPVVDSTEVTTSDSKEGKE